MNIRSHFLCSQFFLFVILSAVFFIVILNSHWLTNAKLIGTHRALRFLRFQWLQLELCSFVSFKTLSLRTRFYFLLFNFRLCFYKPGSQCLCIIQKVTRIQILRELLRHPWFECVALGIRTTDIAVTHVCILSFVCCMSRLTPASRTSWFVYSHYFPVYFSLNNIKQIFCARLIWRRLLNKLN